MLGNALVVVKVKLTSLLPAEWALDGSAILEDLSWECLFTVEKFLLESNPNPILFCLSLRKIEDKEQLSLMHDDSETLNSSASAKHFQSWRVASLLFLLSAEQCPPFLLVRRGEK